jgi:hypothetical protein
MYLNKNNIMKYLLQLIIVAVTVHTLSPCKIKVQTSLLVGLISASLFAIIDTYFPMVVYKDKFNNSKITL